MADEETPRRPRRRAKAKVDTPPAPEAEVTRDEAVPAEAPAANGKVEAEVQAEPEAEVAVEAEPKTVEADEAGATAESEGKPAASVSEDLAAESESYPPPLPSPTRGEGEAVAMGAGEERPAVEERPTLYERWWATGLPNVGAIARRELASYFVSAIGYVVAVVLIVLVSFFGYLLPVLNGEPVLMDGVFSVLAFLMVFFVPLYTMRLLAEERRSGTLEMLLTSPVRDWELVVGKWLGGFVFFLATIAFTLIFVVLLSVYTTLRSPATVLGLHLSIPAVDYGAIVAGYVGIVLLGAAWVAIGLLASSITSNQIIAAVVGIGVLLSFQFLFDRAAGGFSAPVADVFDYLSASNRLQSFNQGQIVARDLLYFVSLTVGSLFVATRALESRKWR